MGMHDATSCINCGRAVDVPGQKFCPQCGQPTPAHRIDWHFLGHELEHSVLHMDRGILYSLKQLMLRPGTLLRDYIDGRRGNQVKPLLMIMVMAAVVVLLNRVALGHGVFDSTAAGAGAHGLEPGSVVPAALAGYIATTQAVMEWINGHFAAFTLLLLPLEALVYWAVFRRFSGLNYPEWLVISALLTVQTFVIWTVLTLLQRWVPMAQMGVVPLGLGYTLWSLIQFFHGRPRWGATWRTLVAFVLFAVLNQLLVSGVIVGLTLLKSA